MTVGPDSGSQTAGLSVGDPQHHHEGKPFLPSADQLVSVSLASVARQGRVEQRTPAFSGSAVCPESQ